MVAFVVFIVVAFVVVAFVDVVDVVVVVVIVVVFAVVVSLSRKPLAAERISVLSYGGELEREKRRRRKQ